MNAICLLIAGGQFDDSMKSFPYVDKKVLVICIWVCYVEQIGCHFCWRSPNYSLSFYVSCHIELVRTRTGRAGPFSSPLCLPLLLSPHSSLSFIAHRLMWWTFARASRKEIASIFTADQSDAITRSCELSL